MLLTTDEAKEKSCPHLFPVTSCDADGCMAWRWVRRMYSCSDCGIKSFKSGACYECGKVYVVFIGGYCGNSGIPLDIPIGPPVERILFSKETDATTWDDEI